MTRRILIVAGAMITEVLRARLSPLIALALLLAAPVTVLVLGDDAATRSWLARSVTAEGLRVLLPVAAILGGGFLLKPAVKRGWTVLPARRSEYFIAAALAGGCVLLFAAGVFAAGGIAANVWLGDDLMVTRQATEINRQRDREPGTQYAEGGGAGYTWAVPQYGEELLVELPELSGTELAGTVEFRLVWTTEAAPRERAPVTVSVIDADGRRPMGTEVLSRHRVRFSGRAGADARLVITPTDPVLIVGTTPDRVRFDVGRAGPAGSVVRLWLLSVAAALLCMCAVLLVRSLATAPTAVLAGLLLLSVLTLLPSLGPTSAMARDRRAAVEGVAPKATLAQRMEDELAAIPPLHPDAAFDEFLGSRIVPTSVWGDSAWRLLFALALLPPGALLFRARQITK